MRVVKETVDKTKVESESLDFEDVYDIRSASPLPKRISSLLDSDQAEVDDSDNDSGFVGVSRESLNRLDTPSPDVTNQKIVEQGVNGVYDREAILYELASSGDTKFIKLLEIIEQKQRGEAGENPAMKLSKDPDDQCREECLESLVERIRKALQALPDSLLHLMTGMNRIGDCARPPDQKPDWLDMEKLRRGQKFAQDHLFSVHFAELISLFVLLSFEEGLKPLIITGKSSTPFAAFKRYLSTGVRVRHWYTQDPWAKGTAANKDISVVRAMHAAVRRRLDASSNQKIDAAAQIPDPWSPTRDLLVKDFFEACEAPVLGQCPFAAMRDNPDRHKGLHQSEMATTQWGFVGLIVSYPKLLGVHYATDEDLEAFIHLWRSIGYQLGTEDEYNFCRGTLEDVRQRSHDYLQTWVKPNFREITPQWEHMMRCLITGIGVVMPGSTYETALLYLAEILDLPMPRLYASLSYKDWFNHSLMKSLFHYTIKIPGVLGFVNGMLNRSLDRAEKFTPEEIEAIRIKLSNYPGNGVAASQDFYDINSSVSSKNE